MKILNKKGFTLIELLVVIAIVGLLSTIVVVNIISARTKARDVKRMFDLDQVKKAMNLYYDDVGDWIETGSGCGSGGNGLGWFNYSGGAYPKSVVQCLIDGGYLGKEIIDPSSDRTSSATNGNAYMKYHCGSPSRVYLYAKLQERDQDSTATNNTCCPTCDSNYGMNYYIQVQ